MATEARALYTGNGNDAVFVVGRQELPFNRLRVANHSKVFKAMFESNMADAQARRFVLKNTTFKAINQLVLACYIGNPNLTKLDEAVDLFALADLYDIPFIKEQCEECIKKSRRSLKKEHVVDMFISGDLCNSSILKTVALDFMAKPSATNVADLPNFDELSKRQMKQVVRRLSERINLDKNGI